MKMFNGMVVVALIAVVVVVAVNWDTREYSWEYTFQK